MNIQDMLIDVTQVLIDDWHEKKGIIIGNHKRHNFYDCHEGLFNSDSPSTFKEFIDYVDSNYKTHTEKVFAYEGIACGLASVMLDMDDKQVTGLLLKTAFGGSEK